MRSIARGSGRDENLVSAQTIDVCTNSAFSHAELFGSRFHYIPWIVAHISNDKSPNCFARNAPRHDLLLWSHSSAVFRRLYPILPKFETETSEDATQSFCR